MQTAFSPRFFDEAILSSEQDAFFLKSLQELAKKGSKNPDELTEMEQAQIKHFIKESPAYILFLGIPIRKISDKGNLTKTKAAKNRLTLQPKHLLLGGGKHPLPAMIWGATISLEIKERAMLAYEALASSRSIQEIKDAEIAILKEWKEQNASLPLSKQEEDQELQAFYTH